MNITPELVAALAKAQSEFPKITKDKTVSTNKYSYSYAELGTIVDATLPVLNANGLSVVQLNEVKTLGDMPYVVVKTTILHTSGGYIQSEMFVGYDSNPQQMGSKVTYARRYDYCCALNLVADDDTDAAEFSKAPVESIQPTASLRSKPSGLRKVQ